MLFHLLNLIGRSIGAIPRSLGSTWLGVLFPIGIALLGETIGVFLFGWKAISQNWRKATGVGFAALGVGYTLLFLYCFAANIYSDHIELVSKVGNLKQSLEANQTSIDEKVQAALKPKESQINQLRIDCAKNVGAGIQMQKQIADQQSQLNTCLIQQKEVPTIRSFMVSPEVSKKPRMYYLLTTNVVRDPVDLIATCDTPISSGSLIPLTTNGSSAFSANDYSLSATQYKFSLLSPAWSPSGPLWVTMFFIPPVNRMPKCTFTVG